MALSKNQISLLKKTIEHYKKEIEITSFYIKAPLFLDDYQFNIPSITDKTPISIILIGANAVFALSNKNKFRCHIVQGTIIPQRGPYKDSTQISHIAGYFNEDGYWYSSSSEKSYQNEKLIKSIDFTRSLSWLDDEPSKTVDKKTQQRMLQPIKKEHYNNRLFNSEKAVKPLLVVKTPYNLKSYSYTMMIMHDKGIDLAKLLQINPFLSLNKRLSLIHAIINKIKTLQESGYIHLDLKLENICTDSKGLVSIIDYESLLNFSSLNPESDPSSFENHDQYYQHPLRQQITHFIQHDNWAAYLIYKTLLWIDEDIISNDILPIQLKLNKQNFEDITKENYLGEKQVYTSLIFLYSIKEELSYFQIKNSVIFLLANFAKQQFYQDKNLISDRFYGNTTLLKNIQRISFQYSKNLKRSIIDLIKHTDSDYSSNYFPQAVYYYATIEVIYQQKYDIKNIMRLMSYLYVQKYRNNIINALGEKSINDAELISTYSPYLPINEINFSTKNIFLIITYLLQLEEHFTDISKDQIKYNHLYAEIESSLVNIFTVFKEKYPNLAEYCLISYD